MVTVYWVLALAWCSMTFALLLTRTWFAVKFIVGLVFAFIVVMMVGMAAPGAAWVLFNGLGLFALAVPAVALWKDVRGTRRRWQ